MERLICSECGMCFDADQERQHRDWHIDQHVRRMERLALAELADAEIIARMTAALNAMHVNVLDKHWLEVGRG